MHNRRRLSQPKKTQSKRERENAMANLIVNAHEVVFEVGDRLLVVYVLVTIVKHFLQGLSRLCALSSTPLLDLLGKVIDFLKGILEE